MNKKLEYFLQQKQLEENDRIQKEKKALLLSLGLYNKAFSPNNTKSTEYPFEWYEMGKTKYYKAIPIDINDEEYEILKKYANTSPKKTNTIPNNGIATLLTVIACLTFIIGFFGGIALGELSFGITFIFWCASAISGISILGFAEIIKLLNEIKHKTK
jgi:hypothetical protein